MCSKNCELLRREGLSRVEARAPVRVAASHCVVEVKVNKKKKIIIIIGKPMVAGVVVFESLSTCSSVLHAEAMWRFDFSF